MQPIHTLGYILQHTAFIMHRQSDQVLQERLGIGMSQFRLLLMLEKYPGVQQKVLADRLGQTEASISRQTKLLCDKGMLMTQVNPKNRREHIALPTPKGIKLLVAAREVLASYHNPILDKLSEKQQEQLIGTMRQLHEEICRPGKPHACDNLAVV